ncbi:MAG: shikimate kinase [Armatimonadota bacterium]|nr:shikimate kinase [Armatimonadota bacterium]
MNIVLIGFMGTGKSAVGRSLATRLKARFVDTDAEIEKEALKSVADIFAQEGEAAFRKREGDLLIRLLRDNAPIVVSTGGGMALRDENVRLLKKIGPIVWLTAPSPVILARVRQNLQRRPLLAGQAQDPLPRIQQLLAERNPRYRAIKDYEFDTSNWDSPEEVASCILSIIDTKPTAVGAKSAGTPPPKRGFLGFNKS